MGGKRENLSENQQLSSAAEALSREEI